MSNCEDIEHKIIQYIDGTLNASDHEMVKQHINTCESCKKIELEYRLLFETIDNDIAEHPSIKLRDTFSATLIKEDAALKEMDNSRRVKPIKIPYTLYKVAAIVVLMAGSYWFGNYNTKKVFMPELADLNSEQQELKRIAALSLFESESASKRIQAVKYSQELEHLDDDILNALINEMLYDKLVNVRLASTRALERFSEYDIVKDAFIEALKAEENTSMQIELIEILAHIKEKRAIPKIKQLIDDDETPIFIKDQLKSELQNLI